MSLENTCLFGTLKRCKRIGTEQCNLLCHPFLKLHGDKEQGEGGLWAYTNIPKPYKLLSSDSLPFMKENPDAYKAVKMYCKNVSENVSQGLGFYFYSVPNEENKMGTGTGKTTGAVAIMHEYLVARLAEHFKRDRPLPASKEHLITLFVSVPKLQNIFNSQFRGYKEMQEESSYRFYSFKERMEKVDLLILDDIGVRDATEAFKNEFFEIIDGRTDKATILTSNVPLDRISEIMDDRIVSRIEGSAFPVTFKGADKRKGGKFQC